MEEGSPLEGVENMAPPWGDRSSLNWEPGAQEGQAILKFSSNRSSCQGAFSESWVWGQGFLPRRLA